MDESELDQLLADLEQQVDDEVSAVLTDVADEYAAALDDATELVAAAFSVSSIARMWRARVPRIMRRLFGVADEAVRVATVDTSEPRPDGWDDLPGRHTDGTLPPQLGDYVTDTEQLLNAVGDRLAIAATQALADGLNEGDDVEQLRARLLAVFARDGAQLGDARQHRIAATESTRVWNASTLGVAQAMTGPDRPLVKQWRMWNSPFGDDRVREPHRDADGQLRLLDEAFTVGGVAMQYPGDPSAPADTTINCRCHLRLSSADRTAAAGYCYLNDNGNHCTCDGRNCEGTAAASTPEETPMNDEQPTVAPPVRPWHTPDGTALAFENQETGDGRIFSDGALQWSNGPWPLMYAGKNLGGHDGSELCGAIDAMGRDGGRITGHGPLYTATPAGFEAEWLLDQGAPLGVSVDLDDVSVEFVSRTGDTAEAVASFASVSVLRHEGGAYQVVASTGPKWSAAGTTLIASSNTVEWHTDPDGTVDRGSLTAAGITLTAAAGDPDSGDQGPVVHTEGAGDLLMRITKARVRGATLVAIPAFKDARIVLEPQHQTTPEVQPYALAASTGSARDRIITYISMSPTPVTARDLNAAFDDIELTAIYRHLSEAVESGHLVRIARGRYVAATDLPEGDLAASVTGDTDLPIVDNRDHEWDGEAAKRRVFEWATGNDGVVDAGKVGMAFLWLDPDADPQTKAAWHLGFADVVDGALRVVPRGVFAVAAVLQGARGGVNIPAEDQEEIRDQVDDLYENIAEKYGDDTITPPWEDDDMSTLEASAWRAMRELPPMPAEFFTDPVAEGILDDTTPGVNYKDGRVWGWVARAGEPHAGFPGRRLTLESLGAIDLTHFNRQRFTLSDGSEVKAGAFTMNTGHHRDGAECETSACSFDDTRTVAGIIRVGMSKGGMWFSGAAGPWLSQTDLLVWSVTQPSYHMTKGRNGKWQLRGVLAVPVPGHSTPLLASAVVERSNLALTAAAAMAEVKDYEQQETAPEPATAAAAPVEALTAALLSPEFLDRFSAALEQREVDRAAELAALTAEMATIKEEITASLHTTDEGK